jgi:hypothetical protein
MPGPTRNGARILFRHGGGKHRRECQRAYLLFESAGGRTELRLKRDGAGTRRAEQNQEAVEKAVVLELDSWPSLHQAPLR